MKVGNLLSGKLQKSIQSDLRTNIRPLGSTDPYDQENVGAHFETIIDLTDKTTPVGSQILERIRGCNPAGIIYAHKSIYHMEYRKWVS